MAGDELESKFASSPGEVQFCRWYTMSGRKEMPSRGTALTACARVRAASTCSTMVSFNGVLKPVWL